MNASAAMAVLPVRDPWFTSEELGHGVTRILEPAVDPFLRANIWHVQGRDRDLLVDTGMGIASLRGAFPELFEREPIVFVTHGHYDHTGSAHEFTDRWAHAAEAYALEQPEEATLITSELSASFTAALAADSPTGVAPDYLIDALPYAGYNMASYRTIAAPPTKRAHDGDVIDLGDRMFEVMHLPGHTPGSAGLFEAETGVLFTGDMVYEGELLDELPESNIGDYVNSMRRLAKVPAQIVHAGHEGSFDGDRLVALVDEYVGRRAS
ncbi:MAG TPA: MBL fold metallo-hydrolase [Actinomycetes bacterium]|nr:MBL fold metallo-hydrolase [Actinomycetes bacterium]